MKLLVSDTGPLNYLLQTGYVDFLPRLFAEVSRGIICIGTLGIIAAASEQQWILFSEAIDRLRKTSIRLPEPVIAEYLKSLS